ncbi:MAG: L-histidine N(alpha)-methyltransferase [Gammaproteobacteria bacterium]|nr:L-histidine N(alpha)-methyltransferase [Gammaproteobacteria bacterium]
MKLPPNAALHDHSPTPVSFREAVFEGLRKSQKTLPCQFFYDARGSELFEQICALPEYYPTRTELGILESIGPELGERVGAGVRLIEFGCGSSRKVVAVLQEMDVSTYVPVDISHSALQGLIRDVTKRFDDLEVQAVCADFTREFDVPGDDDARTVGFYPGSTIGNFSPSAAEGFLGGLRPLLGPGGMIIVGVDLVKPIDVIEDAYNDSAGVTAAFNRNLLERINRELDGTFRPEQFEHLAFFNRDEGRIEMHLVSRRAQSVEIDGEIFNFSEGETIHTENSHKYSLEGFKALARRAGFEALEAWTDARDLFSVHLLRVCS